jgi:hypothetical protein
MVATNRKSESPGPAGRFSLTPREKADRLAERMRAQPVRLPGQLDGLPEGSLSGHPGMPQGDENRDPPTDTPAIPP